MEYNYANRLGNVHGSIIRELFKLAKQPGMIAFGGGNPANETFPVEAIKEITEKALTETPFDMLQYGFTEGYTPLRETVRARLTATEGMKLDNDEILILSGGQQSADLTTKVLVNEGDVIIVEEPTFIGCLNAFRSYGAKLVGVPVEADGVNIEKLEEALKNNKAKFFYTIPSFQNPTGVTMSKEKRQKVYDLCKKYNTLILEDNPYGELRFSGEHIQPIKALDTDGIVIYAGSFSKVVAPAFRLGFIVFNKEMTAKFVVSKQCTDVHSPTLLQHVVNEFMTKYDYEAHIENNRRVYKEKCNLMLGEMEKHFSKKVKFERPEGGLFVMAFLPEGMDSMPFVQEGIKRGVYCVPGIAFMADEAVPANGFRMNYSTPSDEHIIKGVEILGKLTKEWLD